MLQSNSVRRAILILLLLALSLWAFLSLSNHSIQNDLSWLQEQLHPLSAKIPIQRILQFTGNFNESNNYFDHSATNFSSSNDGVYTGPVTSGGSFNSGSSSDVYTGPVTSASNTSGNLFGSNDVFTGPVTSASNQSGNLFGSNDVFTGPVSSGGSFNGNSFDFSSPSGTSNGGFGQSGNSFSSPGKLFWYFSIFVLLVIDGSNLQIIYFFK